MRHRAGAVVVVAAALLAGCGSAETTHTAVGTTPSAPERATSEKLEQLTRENQEAVRQRQGQEHREETLEERREQREGGSGKVEP